MSEHTPTPWRTEKVSKFGECDIYGPNNEEIALIYVSNGADEPETWPAEANAAFIVRAVNSHDKLVEALKKAVHVLSGEGSQKLTLIDALETARDVLTDLISPANT